jgi:hypothetical protein
VRDKVFQIVVAAGTTEDRSTKLIWRQWSQWRSFRVADGDATSFVYFMTILGRHDQKHSAVAERKDLIGWLRELKLDHSPRSASVTAFMHIRGDYFQQK